MAIVLSLACMVTVWRRRRLAAYPAAAPLGSVVVQLIALAAALIGKALL